MKRAGSSKQRTNQITGEKRWWSLFAIMITTFFAASNQTIVSTVVPTIVEEMQGFSLYTWVFSAYMLTSAITVPIVGKLSDIYGRKPFYLFGLLVFGVASVLCGLSTRMISFVLARALQGVGAGAMISMPRATLGDIFSPRERGRWMGILGAVYGLSSIIAPTLGGWLTDSFSWKVVFYVNLPFVFLAGIVVYFALPTVRTSQQTKIDWFGSILLVLGLGMLLLSFTDAGVEQGWLVGNRLYLLSISLLLLVLFFMVERKVKDPLLSPELFKNRIFSLSLVTSLFLSMAMFGSLLFMPLFLQGVLGADAKKSGLVMSVMMISHIVGSVFSGILVSKLGKYKRLAHLSGMLVLVGAVLVSRIRLETGYMSIMMRIALLGFGMGSLTPLLNLVVQNAFSYSKMGVVNATQQFTTSLGGVLATPLLGIIMSGGFQKALDQRLPQHLKGMMQQLGDVDPKTLLTAQAQENIFERFRQLGIGKEEYALEFLEGIRESLASGVHYVFMAGVVFALLCFISTLFLPESHLKGKEYFSEEDREI